MIKLSAAEVQSALLRGANATAQVLGFLDKPFAAERLIASARVQTGLSDFGSEAFREGLGVLLEACATEAALSVVGRATIRWDTTRLLVNLLRLRQAEHISPDISDRQIRQPLFITGLPRSGTTFLHKLLTLDEANQAPRVWQTIYPYLAGRLGRKGRDSSIRKVDRQLRAFERLAPDFRSMHPIDATSPQECSEITAHVFASLRFDTTYRVPKYRRWLDQVGHLDAYGFHKRFLQHLQGKSGGDRWVLKCPDHVFALDAIHEVYPDARLVFVHRDPVKVLSSVTRLTEVLRRPFTRRIDRAEIGRLDSERWLEGTRRMMRASEAQGAEHSTAHVRYLDLIADPLGTIESLYERFGLNFSGRTADEIRQSTKKQPSGGYGSNHYNLVDYGLDFAAERRKFADYMAFFGINPES